MPTSGWPARYLRQASKKVSRTCSRVGLNTRLLPELAKIADQALGAAGLPRDADIAPVQDQPVVRVLQELGRRELEELQLDFQRVLAGRQLGAVCDAEDVRIDRHRGLAEGGVQHHVRRLAPDAGQRLERFAILWHGAAVLLQQKLRQRHHVLRLGAVQADAFYVFLDTGDAELRDLFRRVVFLVEHIGGLVHRLVGRLRGKHHRHQQLERRRVLELGGRVRVGGAEALEDLAPLGGIHLAALFASEQRRQDRAARLGVVGLDGGFLDALLASPAALTGGALELGRPRSRRGGYVDAVDRAGRQAQLAADAPLLDDRVHEALRADDGVDRAGIDAARTADAVRFVDDGYVSFHDLPVSRASCACATRPASTWSPVRKSSSVSLRASIRT